MEEEILKYLTPDKAYLKVLDNKYRRRYTGVTLSYITYELLKAKYKKSEVAKTLLKLQMEQKIKSLFCPDVKKYVFMSVKIGYWYFNHITGAHSDYGKSKYNVHNYLKQFIKHE